MSLSCSHFPHFTEEETESQSGISFTRSYRYKVVEAGFNSVLTPKPDFFFGLHNLLEFENVAGYDNQINQFHFYISANKLLF